MPIYSVIIRNASVFDGAGSAPIKTDIAIDGDKINFIGDLSRESAREEIDASNLYAAPGFIDITGHSDTHWTLFDEPSQESLVKQGVSTILGGSCGSSLAPIVNAEDIENLQKRSDASTININWQTVQEFLDELKNHKLALNFGTLVGHGTLRRASGMDVSREASPNELEKMAYLLSRALREGALGISTSLGRSYALAADDNEVESLLFLIKKAGKLATHHLEDEGGGIVAAVSRIVSLSRASGARSHISHFKVLGKKSWPQQKKALEIIERAITGGMEITADFFPYTATGSDLYLLLPEWAIIGKQNEILGRLSDADIREKIINALKLMTLHYDKIIAASTLKDTNVVGKSLEAAAKDAGLSPEEMIINLLIANNLQVSIFNEVISEENMLELASKDYTAISSDGFGLGAGLKSPQNNLSHPRSFGAFPRALRWLVKEKGVLSWEEAIRKMTSLPAKILGIEKRGQIKEDFFADIVLFDPETITDEADYKNPHRFSRGVEHLFINGQAVLSGGELTGERPGRVIMK
ncbi:MAG: amidohydrolase family protein [Candidatus Niyogibacteria bacterium]|nr:MAG: amidohydrolase family protein [Candidatus Niyogibacteria bacterium]